MPNTQSAEKALRQSKRRRARNVARSGAYRTAVKSFRKAVAAGKLDEAKKLLPTVYQKLDKAAKTGVIKKNKAGRLKGNATRLLSKSSAK